MREKFAKMFYCRTLQQHNLQTKILGSTGNVGKILIVELDGIELVNIVSTILESPYIKLILTQPKEYNWLLY